MIPANSLRGNERNRDPRPRMADRFRAVSVRPAAHPNPHLSLVHTSIATGGGCANSGERCPSEPLLEHAAHKAQIDAYTASTALLFACSRTILNISVRDVSRTRMHLHR